MPPNKIISHDCTYLRCVVLLLLLSTIVRASALEADRLFYLSGGEVCVGAVYKPKGEGPFRAVVFNQNVAKPLPEGGTLNPFPELAQFYTSHQYVLFAPGRLKGKEVPTDAKAAGKPKSEEEKLFEQHQAQADAIFSAISTLKAQAYVVPDYIYVTGYGAGASDALLLADKDLDVRAFVAFSPAGADNLMLQNAMHRAVMETRIPVFVIQQTNDKALLIFDSLVATLKEKGLPNRSKAYPPGTSGKAVIAIYGSTAWGTDVLRFFDDVSQ